jgi:hypothetical protein
MYIHEKDVKVGGAGGVEGDVVPIRRPRGSAIKGQVLRQSRSLGVIRTPAIDFPVAVSVGLEGQTATIGRPTRG